MRKKIKKGMALLLAAFLAITTLYGSPVFASLLPLTEVTGLELDLTDLTPEELKAVTRAQIVEALNDNTSSPGIGNEVIVKGRLSNVYGSSEAYRVLDDASDTIDLSEYGPSFALELIIGTGKQIDPADKRYIVSVKATYVSSPQIQLYAQDEFFNRTSLISSNAYSYINVDESPDQTSYTVVSSPAYDPGAEYYLGLEVYSSNSGTVETKVYKGHFDTAAAAEAAAAADASVEVTNGILNQTMNNQDAGYKASYIESQPFTVVSKNTAANSALISLEKIGVRLQADIDRVYVRGQLSRQSASGGARTDIDSSLYRQLPTLGGESYYFDVPTKYKPEDAYYLTLSFVTSYYGSGVNLDAALYKGRFDTPEAAAAAATADPSVDITASIWTGHKLKYDEEESFTLVVKSGRTVLTTQSFDVHAGPAFGHALPLGLYQQASTGTRTSVSAKSSYSERYVTYVTYTLSSKYFADDEYYFGIQYYSAEEDKPDNRKVDKAVVGHYDSLQTASGQADIKSRLLVDNMSTVDAGYKANYKGRGVDFTVFAEDVAHKYTVRAIDAPDGSDADKATVSPKTLYFEVTGAKEPSSGASADINDIYTVQAKDDTYYYNGYQTLLVSGSAVNLKTLMPTFWLGTNVSFAHANGNRQTSGVSAPDFSKGSVIYSAIANDNSTLKNYFVNFVKQETGGAKLFVNGPDEREIYLNNYYDNIHDIFIANVGDATLEGLKAELSGEQNIKLDEYWTVGGDRNSTLAAFTTTAKTTSYGELANVAKIRLLPTGEGPIGGTLTISADGQTPRTIRLTGVAGNPKIVTTAPTDAVKYVPYSFFVQTNNMHDWIRVKFTLDETEGNPLPQGLVLRSGTGEIYGAPMEFGDFPIKVRAEYFYADTDQLIPDFEDSVAEFTLKVLENTDDNVLNATDSGYGIMQSAQSVPQTVTRIQDYVFSSEGSLGEFIDFWMDGVRLEGDSLEYAVEEGSTKITIRAQTFGGQKDGSTHTIASEFRVGRDETQPLKRTSQNYTINLSGSGDNGGSGSGGSGSGGGGGGGGSTPAGSGAPDTPSQGGTGTSDTPVSVEGFADIRGHWAESVIRNAIDKGLFNGVSATRFDPNGTLSRAMLVTVLWRLAGQPAPKGGTTFRDLDAGEWYSDAIAWAAENGIVQGYADGRFGTGDFVTREQSVTFLFRYAEYAGMDVSGRADLGDFSDAASVPSWAADAMSWAVNEGLVRGRDDGTLSPTDGATRAELATIIVRFTDLADASSV